jgi:hypothetical protein
LRSLSLTRHDLITSAQIVDFISSSPPTTKPTHYPPITHLSENSACNFKLKVCLYLSPSHFFSLSFPLPQYYGENLTIQEKAAIEGEIIRKCLARTESQCSFIEYRDFKCVYRRYASLFFIVGVDGQTVSPT